MPDISMCSNNDCTIKDSCYRFTAKPTEYWQSYTLFKQELNESCEYFISNTSNDTE